MTTKEEVVLEETNIEEDIKVIEEFEDHNVSIMMIFPTNSTSVHILEHY